MTNIDYWFLHKLKRINDVSVEIEKFTLDTLPDLLLKEAKTMGFSDLQIANKVAKSFLSFLFS